MQKKNDKSLSLCSEHHALRSATQIAFKYHLCHLCDCNLFLFPFARFYFIFCAIFLPLRSFLYLFMACFCFYIYRRSCANKNYQFINLYLIDIRILPAFACVCVSLFFSFALFFILWLYGLCVLFRFSSRNQKSRWKEMEERKWQKSHLETTETESKEQRMRCFGDTHIHNNCVRILHSCTRRARELSLTSGIIGIVQIYYYSTGVIVVVAAFSFFYMYASVLCVMWISVVHTAHYYLGACTEMCALHFTYTI